VKGTSIMNRTAFDPSTTTPEQAKKIVAQIADILGVDDPTHDAVDKTLDQLFAVITGDDDTSGPSPTLTSSERKAATALGCSPRDFAAAKRAVAMPNMGHVKASLKRGG
jgi:hypothetical protein